MTTSPVTLIGQFVTLEPIDDRHAEELFGVMQDEEVCRYLLFDPPGDISDTRALIAAAKAMTERHETVAFAQRWNATGQIIGSTRLLDIRPADRQVEIGSTFLARAFWRTPANTESKYLLLRHCFESLGCVRVALKTDGRNTRSQRAIERLGAVREGVLRKHMNVKGFHRDTVYYSILDSEWPSVRSRLETILGSPYAPSA